MTQAPLTAETMTIGSPGLWLLFFCLIIAMLAIDLGIFHRTPRRVTPREAAVWSVLWVCLALGFNTVIVVFFGRDKGIEFFTGYLIEKTLALDNVFVFVAIFSAFQIREELQHRILFWGVLGALALRAPLIFAGSALIQRFHATLYFFGAILLATGLHLLLAKKSKTTEPQNSLVVRWFKKFIPLDPLDVSGRFLVVRNGQTHATTLLLALVAIEVADVIFAVDSIPAIFLVTTDPFLVFTSNIFAVLGLRSLYFLIASAVEKFVYLKPALSVVLVFVGLKMLLSGLFVFSVSTSLCIILLILSSAVLLSMRHQRLRNVR
jgi:tellurite resistance protein TerC